MGRGCCCCNPDARHSCRRWLSFLASLFLALATIATILVLVLLFGVAPYVKVHVEDARLNRFAFATKKTGEAVFAYNISVAVNIRNPNGLSINYTKPLVASFVFYNRRLFNVTMVEKGHRHKRLRTEERPFSKSGDVPSYKLDYAAAEEFKKENATGEFNVEVRLSGEFTLGRIGRKRKQVYLSCPFSVQLAPPGTEVVVFRQVDCNDDKHEKIYF